ncbi:hypothetical protein CGLO_00716 [Colletotrichum gloeosporioides Cg-14]|uniref:Uncharacterized protein n=1 Tax=Colletotrichum gloeosporioides (strain Cg-14) TaxID=1237896 RepID=T0M691_COLGC|nr:hypothetical protein CGLO_00716 [Colletotrichum gloeosporioides Cg-14]
MSDGKVTEEGVVVHVQRNAFQVSRTCNGSDEAQEEGTRAGLYLPNSCA